MRMIRTENKGLWISNLCRERLLQLAESFGELAKNYDCDFAVKSTEKEVVLAERRLWENKQLLGDQFTEMSRMMREVALEMVCLQLLSPKEEKKLITQMRAEGIEVENPVYLVREDGRESLRVFLNTLGKDGCSAEEVTDLISVVLGRRFVLSGESPLVVGAEKQHFLLEPEPKFIGLTGFARAVKDDEPCSGDNFAVLESSRGRLKVILSDGTGSGEKACRESEQVLDHLERFLEAGYTTEGALRMVNSILYVEEQDENHPTIDLCDINLHRGRLELWKLGAAASFLKGDYQVEKLENRCLPLGFFRQTETTPICRRLQDQDRIILCSDGVVEAFGEVSNEEELCQLIGGMKNSNPADMAKRILKSAILAAGGKVRDDMTVGVIGIWENH